ncbi:RNA-dependent RNA polymerase [Phytophthora cinnamomi ormycovirus 11-3]|uniref:RNA-dependent RNA polymerase n=1 Tax=Phytophthora cinnamomi ormycovirus 11-3 TaxID=3239320 RepID=A0AB39JAV9_9VIRU
MGTVSTRYGAGNLSGFPATDYTVRPSGLGLPNPEWSNIYTSSKLDVPKAKLRWGGSWIPYRNHIRKMIPYGPPFYSFGALSSDKTITEDERAELIRFLLCLRLWETTPGQKIMSPAAVWLLSLQKGAQAAEILDDHFSLTWRETEMESYNFAFPARFLPRFEEASDDIKWSLSSTYADPDELDDFRDTLRSLLEELEDYKGYIQLADDQVVLDDKSTSTSYLHQLETTLPHWEASLVTNVFETKKLDSLRCVVNVFPGGTRDTVIADKAANNSIRWIDRSVINILTYVPESAFTRSPTSFNRRKEDVVMTRGWHVLRDLKKCGLTYNSKDLFPIVKEELYRFMPDHRWERMNIFANMKIYDDDYVYSPRRGYGLGMANAVVTLCNIVIYRMIIERMNYGDLFDSFKSKGIFGNDDSDVVFYGRNTDNRKLAEHYLNHEHEIQGRLGNLTNLKKSVIKPYGLFYEEYGKPGWRTKEALVCNAIACAYLAPDIRVAKNYIFSQSDRFNSKWALSQLREVALFWGKEFFDPEVELKIHYEIGGWLDLRSCGLKTSTQDICDLLDKGQDPQYLGWIMQVCSRYITPPRPEFKTREEVKNALYEGQSFKSDSRIQLYTLGEKDLLSYYKRLTTFQRNFARRLETFNFRRAFPILKDRNELLKYLLKNAWHQIPWQISEETTWRNDLEVDVSSELATKDCADLRPENLIRYFLNPEETPYWLQTLPFKQDQKVEHDLLDIIVTCEMGQIFSASQFSNSGALPLFEYFTRRQVIPHISEEFGACKLIQAPDPVEHKLIYALSRHIKKKQKEENKAISLNIETDAWGDDQLIDQEAIEDFNFDEFLAECKDSLGIEETPDESPNITSQVESDFILTDETIDQLLEVDFDSYGMDNLGGFIASSRRAFHAEAAQSSDNGDDDVLDDDEGFGSFFD